MDNDADRRDLLEHGSGGFDRDPVGAESKSRAVYRWRRRVTVAASAVALGAVVVGVVFLSHSPAPTAVGLSAGDSRPGAAASAPATTAPAMTTPATTEPATPTPTTAPSASPTASLSLEPMPADLHLVGPSEVTLTPSDGKYRGTLTLTITNTGPTPYGLTELWVTLPAGVDIDFSNAPPFGACLLTSTPSTSECSGDPVPARGGSVTYQIQFVANYAPQADGLTLSDFDLRIQARAATSITFYPDPTPADNEIAVKIRLAPAA
jgi:hypothetical protein